ncbi:MAG: hypothetical protein IPL53_17400 [Ignavibacteria bacterium]|nr:hypothetical protein [Ignavibacteria bacterium]
MTKKIFNTYNQCIQYLFNLERAGIKYDLRNIKLLLKFSGNPQNYYKSIHIAGTNGKGSVSSIINSYLIEKGIRTGIYTSPHIKDFRERILVNGKLVSKRFIVEITNKYYQEIERIKPSFFEVTTAIAFEYFREKKVNYAVIETGLGGRLDATNILKPVLSVITSLSIDHVDYLGKNIVKITQEKGGIIKKNIPVIVGKVPDVSEKILRKIAKENGSEIILSSDTNKLKITGRNEKGFYSDAKGKYSRLFFPVIGDYQKYNIKTFLSVIDLLKKNEKINYTQKDISETFKNLKANSNFYGRFSLVSVSPKIVIDVSHNLQAIQNIRTNMNYFKYRNLIIIFAMMQDKNYTECLDEIGKLKAKIILTKPEYKRAALPADLYSAVTRNKSRFIVKDNLKESIELSAEIAGKDDLILITGSFFLASDFLNYFKLS